MDLRCQDCAAVVINGVPCHETGCPNHHIDLATGEPYAVECGWCGSDCPCSRLGTQAKAFCDDDCANAYYG